MAYCGPLHYMVNQSHSHYLAYHGHQVRLIIIVNVTQPIVALRTVQPIGVLCIARRSWPSAYRDPLHSTAYCGHQVGLTIIILCYPAYRGPSYNWPIMSFLHT
ncbi:hypothetical protein DPX16_22725 [Anabarilius grahami]|uniref:Uncharacterized protein n=1 Tax=Anabarilius grahami TaxID=495550 RepID=A0A3N0Y1G9_ANAGA|nr:hypothetical protein DPX16_22725 [Anabarilius grahami]